MIMAMQMAHLGRRRVTAKVILGEEGALMVNIQAKWEFIIIVTTIM
jgi:hypothetical protein